MREEVLVGVCVGGWGFRGVGARWCVAKEAVCERPWRGATEGLEVGFERGYQRGSDGGRVGGLRGLRGDEVEPLGVLLALHVA